MEMGAKEKSYAKNDGICQCALAIRLGLLWQGIEYDTSCLEISISKRKSYNAYQDQLKVIWSSGVAQVWPVYV